MNRFFHSAHSLRSLSALPLLGCCALLTALAMSAVAAPSTYVSIRGNDNNDCSRATPCRTFNRAILAVDDNGVVTVVDTGDYDRFEVTKNVLAQAADGVTAVITVAQGPPAVAVTAASDGQVILRGLTLVGTGTGIRHTGNTKLRVERCAINGFDTGLAFEHAGVVSVSDTRFVARKGQFLFTGFGLVLNTPTGTLKATVENCWFEGWNNALRADDNVRVTVVDTVATGNASGFVVDAAIGGMTGEMRLERCTASNNAEGLVAGGLAGRSIIHVSNSTITDNSIGLQIQANGRILSRGNNTVVGNTLAETFSGLFAAK